MSFKSYLQKKKLAANTIIYYERIILSWTNWLEQERLLLEDISYGNIMHYIDHCRSNGLNQNSIAKVIRGVKYYYDYHYQGLKPNPCEGVKIESRRTPLPSPLLSEIQLDELYLSYPKQRPTHIRNKVILGMMCYQGLLMFGDVFPMHKEAVRLEYDTVLVKARARHSSRSLKIKSIQRPMLVKYLKESRKRLLGSIPETDLLIVTSSPKQQLRSISNQLFNELPKYSSMYKSVKQIRASVIVNWLKHHSLREVQYMAGHKYVSSTERYLQASTEELQKLLDKHHPFGG